MSAPQIIDLSSIFEDADPAFQSLFTEARLGKESTRITVKREESKPCGYVGCKETPTCSVIWTCGETCLYCDQHLGWAQRESEGRGISCSCDGVEEEIVIFIMMVVPL